MKKKEAKNLLKRTMPKGNSAIDIQLRAALELAIESMDENEQYHSIGTIEECKSAVEQNKNDYKLIIELIEDGYELEIAELILKDGYNVNDFEIIEIPHPAVFCFGNKNTEQYFDVIQLKDGQWYFSYLKSTPYGFQNELAYSIKEAIEKYELD